MNLSSLFRSPKTTDLLWWIAVVVFTVLIGTYTFIIPSSPSGDGAWYRLLAEGRITEVNQPFATRVLHPWLVTGISRVSHLPINQSFWVINIILVSLFLGSLAYLYRQERFSPRYFILLTCIPFFFRLATSLYLNDLCFSVLLLFFFIALRKERWIFATVLLIPLFLTRESTLLLAGLFILVGALEKRWSLVMRSLFISIFSILLLSWIGRAAHSNIHGLSSGLYLLFKVPFNGLRNLLGLTLFTNTFQTNAGGGFCTPLWQTSIPSFLRMSSVRSVGFCPWDVHTLLTTVLYSLSLFGSAFAFLLFRGRSLIRASFKQMPFWIRLASLYGACAFVLAPFLGTSIDRLFAMSWPLFALGAPWLLKTNACSDFFKTRVIVIHFILCSLSLVSLSPASERWPLLLFVDVLAGGLLILLFFFWKQSLIAKDVGKRAPLI